VAYARREGRSEDGRREKGGKERLDEEEKRKETQNNSKEKKDRGRGKSEQRFLRLILAEGRRVESHDLRCDRVTVLSS